MRDTPRTDAEALKSRLPFALVTRKYAEQLERELNAANAELERERIRLAACGVVADANTPESAKKWRNMRETPVTDAEWEACSSKSWHLAAEAMLEISKKLEHELNVLRDNNKWLARRLQDTKQELEEAKREIAKLKVSSNENYWELSRQRDNMRFALHKIDDAVRYGFKHGSKSWEEVK